MPDPEDMRAAVAEYVTALHRSYLAQADTFPPAVRGRDAAARRRRRSRSPPSARATCTSRHPGGARAAAGPGGGARPGSLPGLDWSLRFYDPVVAPALGLIDERAGPAYAEVRARAGRHDGRLPRGRPARLGADPAPRRARRRPGSPRGHSAAARDFETIRSRVPRPRGAGRRAGRRRGSRASPGPRRCWPGRSPRTTRRVAALAEARRPGSRRGPQGPAGVGGRPHVGAGRPDTAR